ncbi:MAG: DedA family protein [Ignavibacteria bacterium]|jgi:membrane protein DedA with SNARE-associated domain|nr:DedA family protein [Ignavibacteria bacterium]MCU7498122.1 DedA family protein [Ignavibacteria bacterium]MCU7511352.1 DedA family protein [Ignavibacteria bacterium]MCU7523433.1 DedA family protein [Ignavibacteria bacterium]
MGNIEFWISQYGYGGIFILLVLGIVGLPVPDETLLTLTGFLVYKGDLKLIPAFFSAYLGSVVGITLSYTIGRTFGLYVLHKYGRYLHITEEKLAKAHNWFEKVGRWALLIGYFIPGIRHIFAIIAGTSKLELWEFALFAYLGAFIWAAGFLSVGYFFGDKWEVMLESVQHHTVMISFILVVLVLLFLLFKKKILGKSAEKAS